jgi:hypothetical protein
MKLVVVLGVAGALLLVGSVTQMESRREPAGSIPEVVVSAEAPTMLLEEVIVRANSPSALPDDSMSDGAGPVPATAGTLN